MARKAVRIRYSKEEEQIGCVGQRKRGIEAAIAMPSTSRTPERCEMVERDTKAKAEAEAKDKGVSRRRCKRSTFMQKATGELDAMKAKTKRLEEHD